MLTFCRKGVIACLEIEQKRFRFPKMDEIAAWEMQFARVVRELPKTFAIIAL
jgi:hypothetical protein